MGDFFFFWVFFLGGGGVVEKIGYFWLLRFGEKETMLEIDMGQNMMVSFYHMLICDILM